MTECLKASARVDGRALHAAVLVLFIYGISWILRVLAQAEALLSGFAGFFCVS